MADHDDDDEQQPIQFGFLKPPTPAQIKEAQEQRLMAQHSFQNDFDRFFDSLSEEQLAMVRALFGALSQMPIEECYAMVHYYGGFSQSILTYKFKMCAVCGKHHEDDLSAMLHPEGGTDGAQG